MLNSQTSLVNLEKSLIIPLSWVFLAVGCFCKILWHVCTLKFIQVWNQLSTILNLDRLNALGDLTLGIEWWQLQWYMNDAGGQEVAAEFFGHHRVEGEGFTFSFSVGTVLF